MGKQTGLAWTTLSVDDGSGTPRDIRNDITDFDFATPRAVTEVTGVDSSAIERLLLLADYSNTLNGVLNTAANKSHDVFKTVPSTSVARTTTMAIGGATLATEVLYTTYSLKRDASGTATWTTSGVLADGTVPTWA